MRFAHAQKLTVLALALAAPTSLFADFSYQESTQVTGGSMLSMMKMAGAFSSRARKMGEPVITTIYLKDNRLARVSADTTEIIDLDKETITQIDNEKRTYSVETFQQMRDQMAKAQKDAEKQQAAHPAPKADPDADKVQMNYEVHVRQTGVEKQVSGLATKEAIMTMMMNATDKKSQQTGTMAITNDMWMVPEIPGYAEVSAFYMRMATKMGSMGSRAGGGMDMSGMFAANPGAAQGMADMVKEMQKLKGVPVMTVMRMGTTTDGKPLPAASEAPLPPDSAGNAPSGGDMAKQGLAGALSSHFGLGGFGKKKEQDTPPPGGDAGGKPTTSAILMESQSKSSNFSGAPIDASHFEVPAGYKLLQR